MILENTVVLENESFTVRKKQFCPLFKHASGTGRKGVRDCFRLPAPSSHAYYNLSKTKLSFVQSSRSLYGITFSLLKAPRLITVTGIGNR